MNQTKLLDASQPQQCQYAIPIWLRDEQIRANTASVKGRIPSEPMPLREDPIAIVCFGPSLNHTWEKVRDFKFIMTCSGAHRFLLDRQVVPSFHVEVDPRAHKIKLVGEPHPAVEYCIASTCHPDYFRHLAGFDVKLWHVFDPGDDAVRRLPPGESALTGGCGAGLRAMTLARYFGFRELHVFGMDGSEGETGKHAGAHPSQAPGHSLVEYPPASGRMWRTTPAFLEAARQTWHELNQLPDVDARFYGEGLVQAMAKDYVRKPPTSPILAFVKPELISAGYCALNRQLHAENLAYGVGGGSHAPVVLKLAESLKTRSVLDYGCGKGYLAKALPFPIWEYDPAVPEKSESPRPADLVVCTDVLEHIEPDKLDHVLNDLRRVTVKVGYFVIHTGASGKTLADGRNTHLIQRGRGWWVAKLSKFFSVPANGTKERGPLVFVVVGPKGAKPAKKKRKAVAA